MRLALECPNYLFKDIQPLVDFDWILTHLVLQDKVYAEHYKESTNFKVLDNSVNELLEPCSLEEMVEALDILGGVDLIVPPDHLGKSKATKEALEQALGLWEHDKLLPTVQGETVSEVIDCACFFDISLGFDKVAVPYDIACKRTDSRATMALVRAEVVYNLIKSGLEVHLLGFTTINELIGYRDNPLVKSIDTGVPIVYGMNLEHLDGDWIFKKDKPTMSQMDQDPLDFYASLRSDQSVSDKLSAIFWNIAYLRKVIGG